MGGFVDGVEDVGDLNLSLSGRGSLDLFEPGSEAFRWQATLETTTGEELASCRLWTLDDPHHEPWHVLDAINADLARYASLFFDDDLHTVFIGCVIVDRVKVPPKYRGNGFGVLLVAEALTVLGFGRSVAACDPAPFELDFDDPTRIIEQDRLERLWRNFGFMPHESGVWVLDLDLVTLGETRTALRRRVQTRLTDRDD